MTYIIAHPPLKSHGFYEETILEYEKRLSRFCKVGWLVYFTHGRARYFCGGCERAAGQREAPYPIKEFERDERDFLIGVSSDGIQLSSEEMAVRLKLAESSGRVNRIIFFISPGSQFHYDETWALASVCLSVDLQIVLLIEQIYRAHKIIYNEPYHK